MLLYNLAAAILLTRKDVRQRTRPGGSERQNVPAHEIDRNEQWSLPVLLIRQVLPFLSLDRRRAVTIFGAVGLELRS